MKSFKAEQQIKALRVVLDIEQRVSGMTYLKELVRNIANTFEAKYVLVGHAIAPENTSVKTDVVWAGGDYADNFVYELKATPCENVLSGNRVCVYPGNVASIFPEDTLLAEMGVESYIGAPILTENQELSGLLVLLDSSPVKDIDFYNAAVDFLASRIAAELKSFYIEEELKRQVAKRTDELENTNQELKKALAEIKILSGIIPICMHCKKIRDDQGYWNQLEKFISEHSGAQFSHSICDKCLEKHYPESEKA